MSVKLKCMCGRWREGTIVYDHARGATYVQGCPCNGEKAK